MVSIFLNKLRDFLYTFFEKYASDIPAIANRYINYHKKLINNEIKLASISSGDVVLHMGCGAIPATSILFVQSTGACVIGIDNDAKAVIKSSSFITKNKLSDKIKIKYSDALNYPLNDMDVIIVSRGVQKTKSLLNHISEQAKQNARVILRIANDSKIIKKIEEQLKSTHLIKLQTCISYGTTSSILLVKKDH